MIKNIVLFKISRVVDAEDAAVAYLSALAGGEQLDVAPTSVKGIAQRYDVAEFEYRAVGVLSPLRYESGKPITTQHSKVPIESYR